jgi:hypothetical protein
VPGQYSSTEADPTPDFDLTQIICDDSNSSGDVAELTANFVLDPGETVKCTFWNTQRGTITIIKDAQPNDAQDFDFTGSGLSSFDLDDDNDGTLSNAKSFSSVQPGDYSVTESAVDGWDLTDLDCTALGEGTTATPNGATATMHMAAGGSIICTYTNSKPSISIVKTAGNAADGAVLVQGPGSVTYTYVVTNTGPIALQNIAVVDDNGTAAPGDDFAVACPKTTLAAGESMTCTGHGERKIEPTWPRSPVSRAETRCPTRMTPSSVRHAIDKSNNGLTGRRPWEDVTILYERDQRLITTRRHRHAACRPDLRRRQPGIEPGFDLCDQPRRQDADVDVRQPGIRQPRRHDHVPRDDRRQRGRQPDEHGPGLRG